MDIFLYKDNKSSVKSLSKEEQHQLTKLNLSYDDLGDNMIIAMVLGHGINTLDIEICETEYTNAVLALMLASEVMCVTKVETCEASFKILSSLYPDKVGQLRRAKMLNKNLWEVVQ